MSSIQSISRPHPTLLLQYFIWSLAAFVGFPIVFLPLFFKYHTLRYKFDDEGVSMSWGILFRREISLTYARIQDIHVSRGLVERWLGLGSLAIQTASGNAGAEMVIQGLREYDAIRDLLYERMRGRRHETPTPAESGEALQLLREIHRDLAAIRQAATEKHEA